MSGISSDPPSSYNMILLLLLVLISIAERTIQSNADYYDQHKAMVETFRDSFPSEDESTGSSAVSLSADTRLSAGAEPSWEMKLNQVPPAPAKPSQVIHSKQSKQKRNCGLPSITARGLIGSTIKRSEFALTRAEVDEKLMREEQNRKKREVKRNTIISDDFWACETKYDWIDMGVDHYPRYVRTGRCESRRCANGMFHCHPRTYKTKILKRVTPSDSPVCEETDESLPGSLRADWRLITVTITHCCDCSARVPGLA